MGTVAAIVAGFKIFFQILDLMREIGEMSQKKEFTQWLDDLKKAVKAMKDADDERKRFDAARMLTDLTRGIR